MSYSKKIFFITVFGLLTTPFQRAYAIEPVTIIATTLVGVGLGATTGVLGLGAYLAARFARNKLRGLHFSQTVSIGSFDSLEVANIGTIVIVPSTEWKVEIQTHKTFAENIFVRYQKKGKLSLTSNFETGNVDDISKISVVVYCDCTEFDMSNIEVNGPSSVYFYGKINAKRDLDISVANTAHCIFEDIKAPRVTINQKGISDINVRKLEFVNGAQLKATESSRFVAKNVLGHDEALVVNLEGNADVRLQGRTKELEASLADDCKLDAAQLIAQDVSVDIQRSFDLAVVKAVKTLNVTGSSNSNPLQYFANPAITNSSQTPLEHAYDPFIVSWFAPLVIDLSQDQSLTEQGEGNHKASDTKRPTKNIKRKRFFAKKPSAKKQKKESASVAPRQNNQTDRKESFADEIYNQIACVDAPQESFDLVNDLDLTKTS